MPNPNPKQPRKPLSQITESPKPSPELAAKAKAAGATLIPWDPVRLKQFLLGRITLADLEGMPKSAQYELAKIGYHYLKTGDLQSAKKIFVGLTMLDPYDAYFHTALGSIAQQSDEDEEAIHRYSRALEIYPRSAVALANRGEVFLKLGRMAEAATDLVKATEIDAALKYPSTKRAKLLLEAVRAKSAQAQPSKAPAPAKR